MRSSLRAFRDLALSPAIDVVVSDLDGVLRRFDPQLWRDLDAHLGAERGTAYRAVLGSPFLQEVVRGRASHAQWRERAVADLIASGSDPDSARAAVAHWSGTPAQVDPEVEDILEDARYEDKRVFVFTNGTDRVREELDALGLLAPLGPDGRFLLNSAELGAAKPDREAFSRAHTRIEEILGAAVQRSAVAFLDDSPRHVQGAIAFSWQAILLEDGEDGEA